MFETVIPSDPAFIILRRVDMKLTPPKVITFWIALILGFLGFLGILFPFPVVSTYVVWFLFAGWLLLILGLLIKGL